MDMLCLMFDSETRGTLETAGTAWTDDEIARAVHGDHTDVLAGIAELLENGVAHRDGSGAIYSRRMLRDESVRGKRAAAGRLGGRPRKQNESKTKANTKPKAKQIPDNDIDIDNDSERDKRESVVPLELPLPFDSDTFEAVWAEFCEHRRGHRSKWTELAAKKILTKLGAMTHDDAIAAINNSIESGWAGVFPPGGRGEPRSPVRTVTQGVNRTDDAKQKVEMHRETVKAWYAKLDKFTRARLWKEARAGMVTKAVTEDILAECDANEDDRAGWMYHHERLRLGHGPEYERAVKP